MMGGKSTHMIEGVLMVGRRTGGRTGRLRNESKALLCPCAFRASNTALQRALLSSGHQNEGHVRRNGGAITL